MATVIGHATQPLGAVGVRQTVPAGAWRRAASSVSMYAHRIGDRFTAWLRIETRVDRYASYAALGCGALATVLVVL